MSRIAILGCGAWGTALALSLHRRGGHEIALWAHTPELARQILQAKENTLFLPGFPLPAAITVTADAAAISDAEIVVSVIPSEFLRATLVRVRSHLRIGQFIVSATKGLEDGTLYRATEVLSSILEPAGLLLSIGALSGPSFAQEVALGQPTAVTVAFSDPQIASLIQQEFSSEFLRLYTTTDVIGVELGGALKNVIAIAAGVAVGVGLGHNSDRGSHHSRHRRDHAPRRCLRRSPRNPRRPLRHRRSGAHLHRLAQPQSHRRTSAGPGTQTARDSRFAWRQGC